MYNINIINMEEYNIIIVNIRENIYNLIYK